MSFLSFNHHKDLPLDKDPGTRFLPWLIAFMVYLAALSVIATSIMQSVSLRWEQGASDTLTVQIPPQRSVQADQHQTEAALKILRANPAVLLANPMAKSEVLELLEPWLGNANSLSDMPMPHLIDVTLRSSVEFDANAVLTQISQVAPGATLDDHRIWLDRLIRMSQTLEYGAYIVLALIGLASIGTIFFVTKTGLAIHHDVIEVLHLIGAQDSYIARQFAEHSLHLGLRGGMLGLAVAGPTFGGFAYLYRQIDSALLPQIDITPVQWVAVMSLPLISGLMGYLTARSAVLRSLKKMV
ncbi:cell division protein [Terasakiella sp. A23]|uniref:cell division protein FtsX n=1 Tax=Terasakiella sp. FCG-A23 TaxID=3080561 RepID=UPI002954A65C|nr:cell division protein [Terasakiella sp. A23]MDV7338110.1 cell division protein [Terasakiella sp. A23]